MTKPNTPLVETRHMGLGLKSRAGLVQILHDVNLSISNGESVAILGPSGSGKTSLLMVMAGLEQISSGTVRVVGHDFAALGEDELARIRGKHIGIVFQSFNLVPTMTALENVALPLEFLNDGEAFPKAEQLLSRVGLSARMDHFPAQLSGGERQRVALARALAPRPDLLLADEPTGNLDGETGRRVVDLMFDLHDETGTALMLVTHDPGLAARCKRVIRIENGQVIADQKNAPAQRETTE